MIPSDDLAARCGLSPSVSPPFDSSTRSGVWCSEQSQGCRWHSLGTPPPREGEASCSPQESHFLVARASLPGRASVRGGAAMSRERGKVTSGSVAPKRRLPPFLVVTQTCLLDETRAPRADGALHMLPNGDQGLICARANFCGSTLPGNASTTVHIVMFTAVDPAPTSQLILYDEDEALATAEINGLEVR